MSLLYEIRGFCVETRYRNDVNGNGFVSARSMTIPRWTREEHPQHLRAVDPEASFEVVMAHLRRCGREDATLAYWAGSPSENGFVFVFELPWAIRHLRRQRQR